MIALIIAYFMVNSFLAGYFLADTGRWWQFFLWLFFGCLYPLIYIISVLAWVDRKLDITALLLLYFTNWWGKKDNLNIEAMKSYYITANRYKRWIMRQIDKKYNYGITVQDNG